MANYGLIGLGREIHLEAFEKVLKKAVKQALLPGWVVEKAHDGPTWIVSIPGTATSNPDVAKKRLQEPNRDVGFPVSLDGDTITFRHVFNNFVRWAQGCIEEELADHYKVGVYYDAIDEVSPPGTCRRRVSKHYGEYITRTFEKPFTADAHAIIKRFKAVTPKGFW